MSPVTTCHGAQSEIDAAPVSDGRGGAFLRGHGELLPGKCPRSGACGTDPHEGVATALECICVDNVRLMLKVQPSHAKLVRYVRANPGPCDVLLVGDCITQQWGSPLDAGVLNEAWGGHFADCRTINIGICGDKSQNVLWRLDHGGVEGLQPDVVVVMIGNNKMFFVPETGVEAAVKGVEMCVANVRARFPEAEIIAAKIPPCHAPGVPFYESICKTNAGLEALKREADVNVRVLDLWKDFTRPEGTLNAAIYSDGQLHLGPDGYRVIASRLKPVVTELLGKSDG